MWGQLIPQPAPEPPFPGPCASARRNASAHPFILDRASSPLLPMTSVPPPIQIHLRRLLSSPPALARSVEDPLLPLPPPETRPRRRRPPLSDPDQAGPRRLFAVIVVQCASA
jgi:hypothetical protein